jgi:hypothetical protein
MRLWLAALLVALLVPAAASAHVPGQQRTGYVSTVTKLEPPVLGLQATVLGGVERISLRNWSGKRVVILVGKNRPYLLFDRRGVFLNARSPNQPGAPRWERVAFGTSFAWHDHRIGWSGKQPPAVVRDAPDEPHYVREWEIKGLANGKPFVIEGLLGYAPPPGATSGSSPWLLRGVALGIGLLVAAGVAAVGLRRRRDGVRRTGAGVDPAPARPDRS